MSTEYVQVKRRCDRCHERDEFVRFDVRSERRELRLCSACATGMAKLLSHATPMGERGQCDSCGADAEMVHTLALWTIADTRLCAVCAWAP